MNSTQTKITSHSHSAIYSKLSKAIPQNLLEELMSSSKRQRIYDPLTTLRLFLIQVFQGQSTKSALSFFNSQRIENGQRMVSMNNSNYCRARKKLDENILKEIALRCNDSHEFNMWNNRHVKLIDGTTMQMEDTKENQKEYPQNIRQKEGLGQPILRSLCVFSLATASLVDLEIASYSGKGNGEPSLLRRAMDRFKKKDILVMDRFFTSYFLHSDLVKRDIDFVVRARDKFAEKFFKKNRKEVIIMRKRDCKSKDMSKENYIKYPKEQKIRLLKHISKKDGFRDKVIYLMTSLSSKYLSKDIVKLYRLRWDAEINLRNLKRTLGSYFLTSKTPSMVRKELYVKILAYNLTRSVIVFSAKSKLPRKYSFKTTMYLILDFLKSKGKKMVEKLPDLLKNETLNSKFRVEPRALKRRTRGTFSLLLIPRNRYKSSNQVA